MGCIYSKNKNKTTKDIELIKIDNKDFIIITELIHMQKTINFNIKNRYWDSIQTNNNIDLHNKNTLNVIKKLGI